MADNRENLGNTNGFLKLVVRKVGNNWKIIK